jgi:hypothetical protein
MSLADKRRDLVLSTLSDVSNNLRNVIDMRFSDQEISLFFNASTKTHCYQTDLHISAGTVTSGTLSLVSNSTAQKTEYHMSPFPLLFVHQVGMLSAKLLRTVVFLSQNSDKFKLAVLDRLIAEANGISAVLSDRKFTEIEIAGTVSYFLTPIPQYLRLQLQYHDGEFVMKHSGFIGTGDMIAPDQKRGNGFKEIERCLHLVVKSLKYLRSDACTWSIQQ